MGFNLINFLKRSSSTNEELTPKYEFKKIAPEDVIKLTKVSNETQKIAALIMENKFYLTKAIDVLDFSKGMDWGLTPPKSPNTYQLYLHSLNVISYLVNSFEEDQDDKYLDKAYSIFKDWVNYHQSNAPKSNKVWSDHATASRVLNMVYFYSLANGKIEIDEDLFYHFLLEHGQFLSDDQHYNKNNHGIMVDRALITAALVLEGYDFSRGWIEKGIYRIREAYFRDFSSNGVHLENSPEYHSMVVNKLFIQTQSFLKNFGLTLGEDIENKLEISKDYFSYIAKPNKSLPLIGDTGLHYLKNQKKKFDPFIDYQAGIAVLQAKNNKKTNESTWVSFISGYGSKTHKHQDDLSFTLFYKGKDIFIDSGKYNYDKNDKIRNYITSPLAHNTIAIQGAKYKIVAPMLNREKIKITSFTTNPIYDYVKGINHAYEGITIQRALVFIKPNILIVLDKVTSDKKQKYLQIFNLAPHLEVKSLTNDSALLESNGELIEIHQVLGADHAQLYEGDRETPRAIISEKFGTLMENKQLEFSKEDSTAVFLTTIKLGEGIPRLKNIKYQLKDSVLHVELLNRKFDIII